MRSIIYFLNAKNKWSLKIHQYIKKVHRVDVMNDSAVPWWGKTENKKIRNKLISWSKLNFGGKISVKMEELDIR